MKKKYVAVMLGLVLSMSTASVYAAGSTAVTVAADSSSDSSTDDSSGDDKNAPQGQKPDGEPPAKPDGDNSEPPTGEKPDGEPPQGDGQEGPGGAPGGQSQGVESYDAANDYTEDATVDGETLSSTGTDENVAHISDGAKVSIKNSTITRESSDSQGGDNSSFYGVGAAVLATDGEAYVSNSTIDTDSKGAAGLFAYGDGTVYAANDTITTKQDTSGGIHAAGGGKLYAWDMTVETNGESSAAIRSDRGGGTMVVDGGTYTSNGVGSPAIYSTADISVNNATLTANGSEAICIEGLNSIHLFDSDLTGNMSDDDQNDCTWNVILYQSMSGDSEVGNSTFEMNGGSLTAKNGGMFYTTNTESTITLSDVDITYADENDFFLKCTGNSNQRGWGENGKNGADCLFTAAKQEMQGDVVWDSISQLDFYMTDGSILIGAVTDDESNAGEGGDEFLMFVPGVSKDEIVKIVTGIQEKFEQNKEKDAEIRCASVSVGICEVIKGDPFEECYSKADKALYHVKQNGKGSYFFYQQMENEQVADPGTGKDLALIAKALRDSGNYSGALNLEYREFAKLYEYMKHLGDRYRYQCYLVMVTLETTSNSVMHIENIEQALERMEQAIRKKIRSVDACTRYSSMQYLVILFEADESKISDIMERIFAQYDELTGRDSLIPKYEYIPMVEKNSKEE